MTADERAAPLHPSLRGVRCSRAGVPGHLDAAADAAARSHRRRGEHGARRVHGRPRAWRVGRRPRPALDAARLRDPRARRRRAPRCCCRSRSPRRSPLSRGRTPTAPRRRSSRSCASSISLVLVGIPAAAMGATFPIAADWFAAKRAPTPASSTRPTRRAPRIGAIAAGFFLIPAIGLRATTWVGVALNVVAAGGAWWLASHDRRTQRAQSPRRRPALEERAPKSTGSVSRAQRAPRSSVAVSLAVAGAGARVCGGWRSPGFAALVYEVAWTRLLALVIGPTTYAFATMAAAFISGLAIGSAVGTRLARRTAAAGGLAGGDAGRRRDCRRCGGLRGGHPDAAHRRGAGRRPGRRVHARRRHARRSASALLLLPMTLALGATFPLALAVAAGGASTVGARCRARLRREHARRDRRRAGRRLRAACPALGLAIDISDGARSSARSAARRASRSRCEDQRPAIEIGQRRDRGSVARDRRDRRARGDPAACRRGTASCSRAAPTSTRRTSASDNVDTVLRAGVLEYYKEGAAATVSVRRLTGTTSLAIDGKIDASNAGDMLTQRLLGPAAGAAPRQRAGHRRHRPRQRRHGRLRARARNGRRADVVEISPEVVEASRFFDRESGSAAVATRRPADRRRRPVAPAADAAALRRHRVGAVESVDGRRRGAVHARVLRGGARAAEAGRPDLPVGAHLRHQPRRPAVDRRHVRVGVSRRARCGWSATAICC